MEIGKRFIEHFELELRVGRACAQEVGTQQCVAESGGGLPQIVGDVPSIVGRRL